MDKKERFSSNNQEQSTCSEQISQEQFILQLIKNNDISTLRDLGIKYKNMNFLDTFNEVDIDSKISPLQCATYLGKYDIVRMLLDNPSIDVDLESEECLHTPLHLACITGNFEILKLLLDSGAEINKPNSMSQTPFICCFMRLEEQSNTFENRKICIKMAELCLLYGADIDWIVDKIKGYTLLMQYVSIKMDLSDIELLINYEIISFLIENGANTQIKTMKGKNLLELAQKHPNKENIEQLIKNTKQKYFYHKNGIIGNNKFGELESQRTALVPGSNQQQQQQNDKNNKKSKSVMQYLAFCKN